VRVINFRIVFYCISCRDHVQNLIHFSLVHSNTEFRENPLISFCVILLTNKQTNKRGENSTSAKSDGGNYYSVCTGKS